MDSRVSLILCSKHDVSLFELTTAGAGVPGSLVVDMIEDDGRVKTRSRSKVLG